MRASFSNSITFGLKTCLRIKKKHRESKKHWSKWYKVNHLIEHRFCAAIADAVFTYRRPFHYHSIHRRSHHGPSYCRAHCSWFSMWFASYRWLLWLAWAPNQISVIIAILDFFRRRNDYSTALDVWLVKFGRCDIVVLAVAFTIWFLVHAAVMWMQNERSERNISPF